MARTPIPAPPTGGGGTTPPTGTPTLKHVTDALRRQNMIAVANAKDTREVLQTNKEILKSFVEYFKGVKEANKLAKDKAQKEATAKKEKEREDKLKGDEMSRSALASTGTKAKGLFGGFLGKLAKLALFALIPAAIAFLNSDYYLKIRDWFIETGIPMVKKLWTDFIKPWGIWLGEKMFAAWEKIKEWTPIIVENLIKVYDTYVKPTAIWVWDKLGKAFKFIVDGLFGKERAEGPQNRYKSREGGLVGALIGVYHEYLKPMGKWIWDKLGKAFTFIKEGIFGREGEGPQNRYGAKMGLVGAIKWIGQTLMDLPSIIRDKFNAAKEKITNGVLTAVDKFGEMMSYIFSTQFFSDVFDKVFAWTGLPNPFNRKFNAFTNADAARENYRMGLNAGMVDQHAAKMAKDLNVEPAGSSFSTNQKVNLISGTPDRDNIFKNMAIIEANKLRTETLRQSFSDLIDTNIDKGSMKMWEGNMSAAEYIAKKYGLIRDQNKRAQYTKEFNDIMDRIEAIKNKFNLGAGASTNQNNIDASSSTTVNNNQGVLMGSASSYDKTDPYMEIRT